MVSVYSALCSLIFCYLIPVLFAHPVTVPTSVRFVSSPHSSPALEKLFKSVRQEDQNVNPTSKSIPLCSPTALDQALEIDDTCLSCSTNIETGQVSDCAEGCCRSFSLSSDLEAAHFITCYNGCCIRSIGILSPTSDREAGILNFEGVFLVKNDVTLDEISLTGQCVTQDGGSSKCGSTCAVFTPEVTRCTVATSFQVPVTGESFVDPPCPGVDDLSDALAPDETPDGDDDGDAIGPTTEDDTDGEDGASATGPTDGEGIQDDGETTEPSPEGEDGMKEKLGASPTEELDSGDAGEANGNVGGDLQDGAGPDEPVCFPAEATVRLQNGDMKRMDELETGDVVLVGAGKYSKIFGFTHQTNKYRGYFVEVRTSTGEVVRLTHGHYMYSNGLLRRADEVRVGETVRLYNGSVSEIVEIGEWYGVGLFNPQSYAGDLVVDGVVVSTYTDAVDARVAHALLTPVRAVSNWLDVSTALSRLAEGLRVAALGGSTSIR